MKRNGRIKSSSGLCLSANFANKHVILDDCKSTDPIQVRILGFAILFFDALFLNKCYASSTVHKN